MTDNVNVLLTVTEKGLASVQKDIEALRSELQDLGIDMSNVEKRLGGIENASQKVSRAVKTHATTTKEATAATRETTKASSDAARALGEQENATKKAAESQKNLISGRYALYDVANAYGKVGAALAGVAIYAVTVGAQFESAFTNVERTLETGVAADEIESLRQSLVQLSGQIPLTFSQISQIATLGNQLGLGADEVIGFTETVARFAAVSGLSIDAVSNSFGGFLAQTGLGSEYLENLGSSIALVGINSNATEGQIVSLVREIAAGASGAGFAADEIVGLAGALASFQVAPERARGVLDTYFATLNRAVAEGGEKLDLFANIADRTSEELSNLVRSGEGATVFRDLLAGIDELNPDAAQLTQILDGLGLSGLRASNTFQRFLGNLGIADRAFEDAYRGFIEGEELTRQYGYTLDDLSTQFTIFINGLNALAAAISGGAVESLAELLAGINNVIFAFTDFLGDNQFAVQIGGLVIAFIAVTGALLTFRALLFAGTAATYAMRTAIASVGGTALASAGTIRGLTGAVLGLAGGATRGAIAMRILGAAIRSIPVIGLIALGTDLISSLGGVPDKAGDAALSIKEYERATDAARKGAQGASTGADALTDSLGGGGGKKGVAPAAAEAAEKVRTLVDYVSDLNGVFRRSDDLRFGADAAFDEITLAWIKINEEVEKYRQQIRTLTADRKLKEYFLEIAELYEDQVRAGQLREEIAQIDDKLAEAQAGASTELEGNSKAAIENRKVFRDLLGSYEDYVAALASAGASQEQIQAVISQLNADFSTQASALGYNSDELVTYQKRFSDLSTIIAQVPTGITVGFNADPALQALNEFFAKAEEQARQAGAATGDAFGDGVGGGIGGGAIPDDFLIKGLQPGTEKGFNWWDAFWAGDPRVHQPIEDFFLNISDEVNKFFGETLPSSVGVIVEAGGKQAEALWEGFLDFLEEVFVNFPETLGNWIGSSFETVRNAGLGTGGAFAGGITDGTQGGLNSGNALNNWINNQNASAYNNGRVVGSNIGGGIADGLAGALSGRSVGTTFTKGYSDGGYVTGALKGFSAGGYTGAGHWLQPAGVVHAGEYVVPKKHVDQLTGLPNVNYVASLQRGKSAPRSGYAGGGYASASLPSTIELGAGTIGAIANSLRVSLNVGRERLAQSVSQGDSRLAWQGSN